MGECCITRGVQNPGIAELALHATADIRRHSGREAARTVGGSMKSNTYIGRFIDLYFDHKEICIKEVKQ